MKNIQKHPASLSLTSSRKGQDTSEAQIASMNQHAATVDAQKGGSLRTTGKWVATHAGIVSGNIVICEAPIHYLESAKSFKANAEFICRAVNSHDELLASLEAAAANLIEAAYRFSHFANLAEENKVAPNLTMGFRENQKDLHTAADKARAAIAKATGAEA